MLLSLSIKDVILIDKLHLNLESGLSVLTGETGAGKSILLDALGLALGMRGDAALIRQGADQATVTAEFQLNESSPLHQLLNDHGLMGDEASPSSIIFRRVLNGAGRSRAFLNDQMVSVGLLRLFGDALLEIHGQFDRLLDSVSYRLLLDEFGNTLEFRQTVRNHFKTWKESAQRWQEAFDNLEKVRQNEAFLKQQLIDLKKLKPESGEEEKLLKERTDLAHVGKLAEAIREVTTHFQNPPLESALRGAIKALQRSQGCRNVDAAHQALERALTEVVEAQAQIQDLASQLADHPKRLQEIDERLHALRSAARKYGVAGDGLAALHEEIADQLASLDQSADLLAIYAKEAAEARAAYYDTALLLHNERTKAARLLETEVMAELPFLKLPQAQFQVQLQELPESGWTETGIDRIDFLVSMNKGQDFCSLSKSASGGELARLMLALKVALASRSAIPTIIFDEIDTGVGGAVASAIGERLATLAKHVQVLAITHSPQLAAWANQHFLVFKEDCGDFMRTSVRQLSPQERQDELARMLSGAEVTAEAKAAAEKLLNQAS